MKARRFLNLMIVSLVAMTYTSCSNSDDVIDTPDPIVKTYTMSIEAQKGSNGTRALDLDGNTLNSTWTAGETVKVYKDNAELGTLTAQGDGASTSLKGTLTGDLSVNDKLTLKYLSPNYNSQKGTIASISKNCDYSTATVTVSGIAGGNISTTNANFENHQAVIKFTLKDADGKEFPSNPTSFRMTDGTSTVTLTDIPDETYTTNGSGVLYVAFPASGASATITLSATAGDAVYGFGKTGITFEKGKYYGVPVTCSSSTKTVGSSLTTSGITSAILKPTTTATSSVGERATILTRPVEIIPNMPPSPTGATIPFCKPSSAQVGTLCQTMSGITCSKHVLSTVVLAQAIATPWARA